MGSIGRKAMNPGEPPTTNVHSICVTPLGCVSKIRSQKVSQLSKSWIRPWNITENMSLVNSENPQNTEAFDDRKHAQMN